MAWLTLSMLLCSYALLLLREMQFVPRRTEMPAPLELEAITAQSPLLVRVCVLSLSDGAQRSPCCSRSGTHTSRRYHLDGRYETLAVHPWTTIELLYEVRFLCGRAAVCVGLGSVWTIGAAGHTCRCC